MSMIVNKTNYLKEVSSMNLQETLKAIHQVEALAPRLTKQPRRVALAKASKMLKK